MASGANCGPGVLVSGTALGVVLGVVASGTSTVAGGTALAVVALGTVGMVTLATVVGGTALGVVA